MNSREIIVASISTFGKHLQISGHQNKEIVDGFYEQVWPLLKDIDPPSNVKSLQLGMFCFANRNVNFRRAIIATIINSDDVSVNFPDYGDSAIVNIHDIRLGDFSSFVIETPPMCSTFILNGIINEWQQSEIEAISQKLLHEQLEYRVVTKIQLHDIVQMTFKKFDLTDYLLNHLNLGIAIDEALFRESFLKILTKKAAELKNTEMIVSKVSDVKNKLKAIKPARPLRLALIKTKEEEKFQEGVANETCSSLILEDSGIDLSKNEEMEKFQEEIKTPVSREPTLPVINETLAMSEKEDKSHNSKSERLMDAIARQGLLSSDNIKSGNVVPGSVKPKAEKPEGHQNSWRNENGNIAISNKMDIAFRMPENETKIPFKQTESNFRTAIEKFKTENGASGNLDDSCSDWDAEMQSSITNDVMPRIVETEPRLPSADSNNVNTWSMEYRNPPMLGSDKFVSIKTRKLNYKDAQYIYSNKNKENDDPNIVISNRSEAFKSITLHVGTTYEVFCCLVEKGPQEFYVQLKINLPVLLSLMLTIEKEREILEEDNCKEPAIGMPVLVRDPPNIHLYRGVITSVSADKCSIICIDYGRKLDALLEDIFVIPSKYFETHTFAIKFTLSGYNSLESFNDQLNKTFQDLVWNQHILLKVVPSEGIPCTQYCELYLKGVNVLSLLANKQEKPILRYPRPSVLIPQEPVVIRYIKETSKFFVQKKVDIDGFDQIMDELNLFYHFNEINFQPLTNLHAGLHCVCFHDDGWFRAEIVCYKGSFGVLFVDYGHIEHLEACRVLHILEKYIIPPRQAIQCALRLEKYFKVDLKSAASIMEMLAQKTAKQRQPFLVEIFELYSDGTYLVNLHSNSLNVANIIYMLQSPRNQKTNNHYNDDQENLLSSSSINRISRQQHQLGFNKWHQSDMQMIENQVNKLSINSTYHNNRPDIKINKNISHRSNAQFIGKRPEIKLNKTISDRSNTQFIGNRPYIRLNQNISDRSEAQTIDQYQEKKISMNSTNLNNPEIKSQEYPEKTSPLMTSPLMTSPYRYRRPPSQTNNNLNKTEMSFENTQPLASVVTDTFKDPKYLNYFREDKDFTPERLRNALKTPYYQAPYDQNKNISDNKNDAVVNDEMPPISETIIEKPISPPPILPKRYDTSIANKNNHKSETIVTNPTETSVANRNINNSESEVVNLNLLIGQTILVTILDLTDIYKFKIHMTGSPIQFNCSYADDIDSINPEMIKRSNNYLSGKTCKLSVVDITADKLVKVKPIENKLGVIDICNMPIIYDSFLIKIISASSMYRLYAHNKTSETHLTKLVSDMRKFYESSGKLFAQPEIGNVCAAKSVDDNWYRGRILSTNIDAMEVVVFYVDYGKCELIKEFNTRKKIKILEEEFANTTAYATEINLPISNIKTFNEETSKSVLEGIKMLIVGKLFKVKVIEIRHNHLIGNIYFRGENIVKMLRERGADIMEDLKGIQEIIDEEELTKLNVTQKNTETIQIEKMEEIQEDMVVEEEIVHYNTKPVDILPETTVQIQINSVDIQKQLKCKLEENCKLEEQTSHRLKGYVSYFGNPNQFSMQMMGNIKNLQNLQQILQLTYENFEPLNEFANNSLCIAYSITRKQWCRARIRSAHFRLLQFIDFGDFHFFNSPTELRETPLFSNLSPLSFECSLAIIPNQRWVDCTHIKLPESQLVEFEYIKESDTKSIINLFLDGENLSKTLIETGFGLPLEVPTTIETCKVSHINNMTDFYIQIENEASITSLVSIQNYLSDFESFEEIKNYRYGIICAAKSSNDNCFYRAKVLGLKDEGFEVNFIDIGKMTIVSDIRRISDEIAKLPPMALNCSLDLPIGISPGKEAEMKFIEMTDSGNQKFSIELKDPKFCSIICLYKDSVDIMDELLTMCDKLD